MTAAYFAWVVNRIGQTTPHLFYEHPPKDGPLLRILSCHKIETDDPWSLSLDDLVRRHPRPQEESAEVYK